MATRLPLRLGLARRQYGRERGAVLVEAVIVIPILMLITLGIIEYGSAYQQDAAVAAASRAGARVASAMSKTAPYGSSTAASDGGVVTANAVAAALQSVGSATPTQMEIWRVEPGDSSCAAPSFTGCSYKVNYTWNSTTKLFNTTPSAGSVAWPTSKQYACVQGTDSTDPGATAGPNQIGIWVQMTHVSVTRLFGGSKTLTGTTIMRLEPDVNSDCVVS